MRTHWTADPCSLPPPASVCDTWAQGYMPFHKHSGWFWYASFWENCLRFNPTFCYISREQSKQSILSFGCSSWSGPLSAGVANYSHCSATYWPESQNCSIWARREKPGELQIDLGCVETLRKVRIQMRKHEYVWCVSIYKHIHMCTTLGSIINMDQRPACSSSDGRDRAGKATCVPRSFIQCIKPQWPTEERLGVNISVSRTLRKAGLWGTVLKNRLEKKLQSYLIFLTPLFSHSLETNLDTL